ncbi:MAG TPA: AI-2E family transporter [Acidimicrobiales bacterium]|jgi:predicted PurR-regulated permease PerM|nr:AI-2E family transporter [Acidimicrobiales bacterium]
MATALITDDGVSRRRSMVEDRAMCAVTVTAVSAAEPEPDLSATRSARVMDLDWRSVAVALGAFVSLLALTGFVRGARDTMTSAIIGLLLALALNPLVSAVQGRVGGRRAPAVAVVLIGFLVAVGVLVALLGPPTVREARNLRHDLPRVVRQVDDLPVFGDDLRKAHASQKLQRWIEDLPDRLEGDTTPIERAGRTAISGLLSAVLTIALAVALMLDGPRLLAGLRRLVPVERRAEAERLADLGYQVVGRYVAGSVFVALIAGVFVLVTGLALGVPLTPLVAVWVGVFDLVPQIGGAAGGIPFVLLAFTKSALTGVITGVLFVLYLQIENHVIQPLVVGKSVKLSPPATMTAALVGVSAAGVVGALVAVPLVGALKVAYLELRPSQTSP